MEFAGEQRFLTPLLANACKFLQDQRQHDAWGQFRGSPISLYHTSLVLSVLRTVYPDDGSDESESLNGQIAATELVVKAMFSNKANTLDISALADFIGILRAPRVPAQDDIDRLGAYLTQRLTIKLQQPQQLRVREFAHALIALSYTKVGKTGLAKSWAQQLQKLETPQAGGWPGGADGAASIIVTARVVEALRLSDPEGAAEAIQRGERFLEGRLIKDGWQQIGSGADVFAQATVLRVLAGCAKPETIEAGVAALKAAANQDGWGAAPGQASTIEATATALAALIACGENRFVLYRVATARVAAAANQQAALEDELARLRQEFSRRVTIESSRILADRDQLRRETQEQGSRIKELENRVRVAEREALEQARLFRDLLKRSPPKRTSPYGLRDIRWRRLAMAGMVGLSYAILGGILVRSSVDFRHWLETRLGIEFWPSFTPVMSALAAGLVVLLLLQYLPFRRRRRDALFEIVQSKVNVLFESEQSTAPVTSAVREFSDIASFLPMTVREEITYLLASRIADMPKDVGVQYAREILASLEVPAQLREQLLSWIARLLAMDSFTRRVVLEQIRRQAQPT